METSADLGYGIFLQHDVVSEHVNAEAAYEAAKKITASEFKIDSYFDVEEDEDGRFIDMSYPAELLGMLAAYHPDYEAHLTYGRAGDRAGSDDGEEIIIFITATTQSIYHVETVEPPVSPSEESVAVLEKFCKTFLEEGTGFPAVSLLLASSCD